MPNLSQIKRQRMLDFLETLKKEHTDDESIRAFTEIENQLRDKKYGLVWEEHSERVDEMLEENIPIFTEDVDRKITISEDGGYNFILEGDNLQSLYLLEKTHKGKIDVIYIDPPYNTGNNDFVYDDCFVDDNDGYRHSKWLSFMSERLLIANRLLSPKGTLIISIGYQEVHNLMLLCQDIFYEKQIMCVTVQTSGGKPSGGFTLLHEYLIFITDTNFEPNTMSFVGGNDRSPFEGLTLSTFDKTTRPNQAYPIFIDTKTGNIASVGKSLAERLDEGSYTGDLSDFEFDFNEAPKETVAIWPISSKGAECVWRLIPTRLMHDWERGYIKVSKNRSRTSKNRYSIQYLPEGVINKIESGELEILGKEENAPTLILGENQTVGNEIPSIWSQKEFFTNKGTTHLKNLFGDKRFSYPKPLEYIIEILRATTDKDSTVLDFFAGSGTTGESVLELNIADGGRRSFILCTNNENNICEDVTYPRVKTVITGERIDGSKYSDGCPANLKYFKCDWTSRKPEDYLLSNALCLHIREMIELQNGIEIDNVHNVLILNKDDFRDYVMDNDIYSQIENIWVNQNIVFNSEEMERLNALGFKYIPREFFGLELKEAAE